MAEPEAGTLAQLVEQARQEEARLLRLLRELDLVATRQRLAARRLTGDPSDG